MNNEQDRFLLYLLKLCKGIGNISLLRLCSEMMKNANRSYSVNELISIMHLKKQYINEFTKSYLELESDKQKIQDNFQTIKTISLLDEDYPDDLRHIYNPPVSLFYEGDISLLHKKSLALIGTRLPTPYANNVIKTIIKPLVENNLIIVSGLAKGTDSLVHKEVIKNKGETIGVIGTGLDITYPKGNESLQEEIAKEHLLITEYPHGSKPLAHHFPQRNRIIAGLAMGTCVVQAKKRSGSLITAQIALDSGKDVFAVPGNLFAENSEGCHLLIQHGAKCIWNAEQIIEEYTYY